MVVGIDDFWKQPRTFGVDLYLCFRSRLAVLCKEVSVLSANSNMKLILHDHEVAYLPKLA